MAQWIEDPQGREEIEKVTKELKLPVWKANHKGKFRDFWNELWDKIEDYCIKLKEGTKKIDDRLNSAIGRNDGDFPITNAVVGNVYYSELTKKYYKCKVGGPAPMPNGNFIDMSILENLNRLENLLTKYGNFTTDNNKISGNISLNFKNNSNDVLNQKFSITENGLYFISATQRVTNTREESESVTITINSNVVTRHDFNIPVVSSRRETNVTITTVAYLTTTDVVNVTRSHCDYVCRQRDLFILKLSN